MLINFSEEAKRKFYEVIEERQDEILEEIKYNIFSEKLEKALIKNYEGWDKIKKKYEKSGKIYLKRMAILRN